MSFFEAELAFEKGTLKRGQEIHIYSVSGWDKRENKDDIMEP